MKSKAKKKKEQGKFELLIISGMIALLIYLLSYQYLLAIIFNLIFPDNYFIYNKNEFVGFIFYVFLCQIFVYLFNKILNKSKLNKKKKKLIKPISSILIIITLFISIFAIHSDVWVFDNNKISNTNIFTGDIISYDYSNIKEIKITEETRVSKGSLGKDISPLYNIVFDDEKEISIYIEETIYSDESRIVNFDKKLKSTGIEIKRT